jgi:protein disulfide-isomerase
MRKILILTLVITLFAMLGGCQANKTKDKEIEPAPVQGKSIETVKSDYAGSGEWLTDYKKALTIAQETKRPILMNFTGSDWCIWCQRLSKEVFNEKAFSDFAMKNLVLLKLDFPQNIKQTEQEMAQNKELADRYKIEGYPTIILLNPDGKEINRIGYEEGGAVKYVKHLQELLGL